MMNKNNQKVICVFSGNRADYGPLKSLIVQMSERDDVAAHLIVSKHHAPKSLKNFKVWEIDIDHKSDGNIGAAINSAVALEQVARKLEQIKPTWFVVLGDRFEALSAAQASVLCHVPIAHICGGDRSEGAFDVYFRDAITKLADIHFVTNRASFENVMKLGEKSEDVYLSGHPGVDGILEAPTIDEVSFFSEFNLSKDLPTLLFSFHSVTQHADYGANEFYEVMEAINKLLNKNNSLQILATGANSDPMGDKINYELEALAKEPRFAYCHTLGFDRFRAALEYCQLFFGNSSAIIYEAPAVGQRALLVGQRQAGRERPEQVRMVEADSKCITQIVDDMLLSERPEKSNFFGAGDSARMILDVLVDLNRTSR